MITEDYVSFEVAKMLQEKGFDIPVLAFYWSEKSNMYQRRKDKIIILNNQKSNWNEDPDVMYSCPTHQMAMAWLREEKNIFIVIEPHAYDYVNKKNKSYSCSLWVGDNYYEYLDSRNYPSYEEATEAALRYILKNLI